MALPSMTRTTESSTGRKMCIRDSEYDTRLKSLYKRMLNGLTGLYGPPMNLRCV